MAVSHRAGVLVLLCGHACLFMSLDEKPMSQLSRLRGAVAETWIGIYPSEALMAGCDNDEITKMLSMCLLPI